MEKQDVSGSIHILIIN